jgi:hypothetical protein
MGQTKPWETDSRCARYENSLSFKEPIIIIIIIIIIHNARKRMLS